MRPDDEPLGGDAIATEAAGWLARRDRGMTAAEQDDYLQWLGADPRHVVALNQIERGWRKLNRLSDWRPSHSQQPNPDLLAPRRRRSNFGGLVTLLGFAACAAITVALFYILRAGTTEPRQAILHPGPERRVLEDGSVVELKPGAAIDVEFTAEARNVRLRQGEGYFAVAKDPARPFVVTAGTVDVRAVGTEFCVTLNPTAVSVLVTEGRVQVDKVPQPTAAALTDAAMEAEATRVPSQISAGQQAVIQFEPVAGDSGAPAAAAMVIRDITPAEVDRALAWQSIRLEFIELPLRDVVREFNRFNVRKLVIADDDTGAMQVGGSFRADNVDSFVRLLVTSFGMTAEARGEEIVLRGARTK